MRYAVAYVFDNDLKIKIVEAVGWRAALEKAFPALRWLKLMDLEKTKEEAFNNDILFDVKEIK